MVITGIAAGLPNLEYFSLAVPNVTVDLTPLLQLPHIWYIRLIADIKHMADETVGVQENFFPGWNVSRTSNKTISHMVIPAVFQERSRAGSSIYFQTIHVYKKDQLAPVAYGENSQEWTWVAT